MLNNKTDDNAESGADTVPELVSVEAGNVGNHIGADFWEKMMNYHQIQIMLVLVVMTL